jgi:hypothetical protein
MPDWETFAVVTGGVAGQVLVDFAVVMLTAVLLSVPSRSPRTQGAEMSALGLAWASSWSCSSGEPRPLTPYRSPDSSSG